MHAIWQHILAQGAATGWVHLALIPFWAAFIGWLTTWLAIRMIFRPQREINILGLKIQGLIHKRKHDLATSIGRTVEKHLISHEDVLALVNRPETQSTINATIESRVGEFLETKLKSLNPMVGMFLTGGLREKLKRMLVDEIQGVIPQFTEQMITRLESELDFQAIITEKVEQFDMNQLETIIYDIARRELTAIELLCGVLGFFVGLIQVGIMLV